MGISKKELKDMNAYFRALNYISVGQLYLLDNPLLKEELKPLQSTEVVFKTPHSLELAG